MLTVFWDIKKPITIVFLKKSATINSSSYCQLINVVETQRLSSKENVSGAVFSKKVMLTVFWDIKRHIANDFLEESPTINSASNCQFVRQYSPHSLNIFGIFGIFGYIGYSPHSLNIFGIFGIFGYIGFFV